MEYIHITLYVLDGKSIMMGLTTIEYSIDEFQLICTWNKKHQYEKRVLFSNGKDVKCFDCMLFGNYNQSKNYKRVGYIKQT